MDYTSEVNDIDEVTRQIKVVVPKERFEAEYAKELKTLSRNVSLKGFRPGKAPVTVVERLHGSRVRLEVTNTLISNSLSGVIREQSLAVVGDPEVDITDFEQGKDLSFTAQVSLYPSPTITGYESFEVEVPKKEATEEEVDQVIERLRRSKASISVVTDRTEVQWGDVVDVEMIVSLGDEQSESPETVRVQIGEGDVAKEVEEQLVGCVVGKPAEFTVEHGEDAKDAHLRGKSARYKVTVTQISVQELPEVDAEFLLALGLDASNLDELREKVREQLQADFDSQAEEAVLVEVLKTLGDRNPFKIPQAIIDHEIRGILVRYGLIDPSKHDVSRFPVDTARESLGEGAEQRVRSSIIIDTIAEQEKVEVSEEDIEAFVARIAERSHHSASEVKKELLSNRRAEQTRGEIRRDKVVELLKTRASVSYREPKENEE